MGNCHGLSVATTGGDCRAALLRDHQERTSNRTGGDERGPWHGKPGDNRTIFYPLQWENMGKWSLKLIFLWRVIDDSPLKWRYIMIMIDNWWIYVTMLRNTKLHHPVGGLHLCRADTSAPMLMTFTEHHPIGDGKTQKSTTLRDDKLIMYRLLSLP